MLSKIAWFSVFLSASEVMGGGLFVPRFVVNAAVLLKF